MRRLRREGREKDKRQGKIGIGVKKVTYKGKLKETRRTKGEECEERKGNKEMRIKEAKKETQEEENEGR